MANNLSNSEVINTVGEIQQVTMTPTVVKTSGAGKAYQSVAQSTAIAVQDATDQLRNMSTVGSTAVGMAMAQLLADPDNLETYGQVITQAQGIVTMAASQFKTIGENAAEVLQQFPAS